MITESERIGCYQDIYGLGKLKEIESEGFNVCRFYMLANCEAYTEVSPPGTSDEDFSTYDGYTMEPHKMYKTEHTNVGKGVELVFNQPYELQWERYVKPQKLYFLCVKT